ncbi:hypothetical protein COCCADRAFT_112847 [Bipolaris zeicola 26-R-13]|uniref:Uncharacterized protein n=1 Tax=Cochliobolus carbonum (strain 26-R-13) TaxID=930089 RepID=W6Y6Q5_COCC2|nr:uncharacterized protein COCCADRAFT_112847 [Bipolaris zeicola 26-R-13]EUC26991.1 hypothetical protein COCCADRAFT_112847 [Bipolaris zeicola 26-R-13]
MKELKLVGKSGSQYFANIITSNGACYDRGSRAVVSGLFRHRDRSQDSCNIQATTSVPPRCGLSHRVITYTSSPSHRNLANRLLWRTQPYCLG